MKKAIITGVTGQDGAYLSEFLMKKNYIVHGIKRRSSSFNTSRIDHIYENPQKKNKQLILHYGDMSDSSNLTNLIAKIQPDEIYNLAAMSHVKVSFEIPEYVANINALGSLRVLEAVRTLGLENKTKIYQASTSELFGEIEGNYLNEKSKFYPKSPYAIAKLYAYWITVNYRESYNMFASNGILFNHESPLRGETFVTRKITMGVAKIAMGIEDVIYLGNLNAERDWGHAKEYVEMMWMILQHNKADDWVISTGKCYSIRTIVKLAFEYIGITLTFLNEGIDEIAVIDKIKNHKLKVKVGQVVLRIDPNYYRPVDVNKLVGDSSKAKRILNWQPKIGINQLIAEMMEHDLKIISNER